MRCVLLDDVLQPAADRLLELPLLVEGRRVERSLEVEQNHQSGADHRHGQAMGAAADREVAVDGLRDGKSSQQDRRRERRQYVIGPTLGLPDSRECGADAEDDQYAGRDGLGEQGGQQTEDQQCQQRGAQHIAGQHLAPARLADRGIGFDGQGQDEPAEVGEQRVHRHEMRHCQQPDRPRNGIGQRGAPAPACQ